jgi:hypothetical protein
MNDRPEWRLERLWLWQWIMLVVSEKKIFTYVTLVLLYGDAIVLTLMGFFGERANEIHVQNLVRTICPMSEFSSMRECTELASVFNVCYIWHNHFWICCEIYETCEIYDIIYILFQDRLSA